MTKREAVKGLDRLKTIIRKESNMQIALDMAIEALEQEPSNKRTIKHTETHACDYISRQAAIEALYDKGLSMTAWGELLAMKWSDIQKCIEQLPSTDRHGKWIPVSERLPEIEGKYLVTFCAYEKEIKGETVVIGDKNKSVAEVGFGCSQKDVLGYPIGFGWYDLGTADYYDKESIVAWMPLPEAYREGES